MAVALFNRTTGAARMTLRLKDAGWQGRATARDMWRHEDAGELKDESTWTVPGHGVVLLRLTHPEK
jgi:alpha-galactosidase